MAKVEVKQQEGAEVPKEILAEAIVNISDALSKLIRSGLNHDAVVALIHDDTGISKRQINTVLDSMRMLKQRYCRQEKR